MNRLASMSPAEFLYRLKQKLTIEYDRLVRGFGQRQAVRLVAGEAYQQHRASQNALFSFSSSERVRWANMMRQSFAPNVSATLGQADAICQHQYEQFGHRFELDNPIDWHRDPLTGQRWPTVYWANIDIRDDQAIGGVKWVWELNRHHHLVTLGKAYFLTGNERFAQTISQHLYSWIDANPSGIGVNWTSSLELAVRLINWTWALAFIRQSSADTPELWQRVTPSIIQQTQHVRRYMSQYSSANNHLVGEAAALATIGLAFAWLPGAKKWRNKGLQILTREIEQQIHTDGVPAEQAIHYLAFVLDFYLIVWSMVARIGLNVPSIWRERLTAACVFISHIVNENGYVPAIGDSDDAHVIRFDDRSSADNFRSILATAAALLGRADLKAVAGGWDEKSHWLLGEHGRQTFEQLECQVESPKSRAFAAGGYYVMRVPGRLILFDCGPLGYLATAAHGHADALSVTISLAGQPFLIDPGTYAYQEGGEWRDYYRSTAAHNTVTVGRKNQSEMLGTFLWGHKTICRLHQWTSTREYDLCLASHYGYTARLGVTHQRAVYFHKPHWLLVADWLFGNSAHYLAQWWHFHRDCQVEVGNEYISVNGQNRSVWMWTDVDRMASTVSRRVHHGETNPIQGWLSPHYGYQEPASALAISGTFQLPVRLTALFCFDEELTVAEFRPQKEKILHSFESILQEVQH
jgi:uncharacterized heparinase superfamily protein